ncbi:MAG TPA: GNAT family protein [Gemmatimonadaceae bacterium]|nr:GNAT family protein [Gemmatimonadaceae bacterium]
MPMRLEGSRCAVRPWQLSDADAVVRHANNLNVARQLRDRFPHPYSRANALAFLKAALSSADESNLAIEVDGEAAGAIGYVTGTDVERYSAEIGYWLGEAHWGRGIVTEALVLVTEHVFATAGVLRLFALPFVDNSGSIRVLEKAGYVREGILKCSSVKYGKPRDQALYARINPDWRGGTD